MANDAAALGRQFGGMLMTALLRLGFLLAAVAAGAGCVDHSHRNPVDLHDRVPPAEPRDVYSVTGDGQVIVYWSPPGDRDLAGFRVFISRDDAAYYPLADLTLSRRHFAVDGTALPASVPFDFVNGSTYFFGVEAVDDVGNTSKLTETSTTFDTPRPAGRDLRLYDANGPRFAESGYDFSRSPYGYALDGTSLFADIYFTTGGGLPVMRTEHPLVVEMQDKGLVDFDDDRVGYLFEDAWRPSSEVRLQVGHVVLVKIYEETRPGNAVEPFNVAKFQVVGLDAGSVLLDWAYQIAPNSRELKPSLLPQVQAGRARQTREVAS